MKFKEYLDEAKIMKGSMIGFGVDKTRVKRLSSYIKSWLIRYKIDFDKVETPHISIAQIPSDYDKDELVRKVNDIKTGVSFNPKEIHIFRGVEKDWIVIEYKANFKFIEAFQNVNADFNVKWFGSIKPHVSLFSIEKDAMDDKLWHEMLSALPPLPKVKAEKVELWNSKFKVEYMK